MSEHIVRQFERLVHGRSFRGLMAVYEQNYLLINRLVPELAGMQGEFMSPGGESPHLYLRIEEQSRFTTTLRLTYFLELGDEGLVADPNLLIRAYHDARQCEVLSCRLQGFMPLQQYANHPRPMIDCKWDSNIFLEKWLTHALELGYRFDQRHASRWPEAREDLETA